MKKRVILCCIALLLSIVAALLFFTQKSILVEGSVNGFTVNSHEYTGFEYLYSSVPITIGVCALIALFAILPLILVKKRLSSLIGLIGLGVVGVLVFVSGKFAADTAKVVYDGLLAKVGYVSGGLFLVSALLHLWSLLYDKKVILQVFRVVQGALIGGGAILPGISGGVMSVLFGIYRPLMQLFTHPIKAIKENWRLFIPVGIGAAAGFVLFAKLMALLFADYEPYAASLFFGLIIGTVPMLWKDAGSQGRTKGGYASTIISFLALGGVLTFLLLQDEGTIQPNAWWYLFCGGVWGLSLIVPGLSSSAILIVMGLYEPMSEGIGSLNFGVIIPLLVGIVAIAALLARFVNMLFDKKFTIVSHGIVGLVTASAIMIIPQAFKNVTLTFSTTAGILEIVAYVVCVAVGFLVAYAMDVWGKKIKKDEIAID